MNRSRSQSESPLYRYRFGAVEFDEARMMLSVDGRTIELEQRPLQLLAVLLRYPDEVVTREELFESIWAGRPTVDNVLANAVAKLRKALGEIEGARIVTLPRVGYRLTGPVERHAVGRKLDSRLELKVGAAVPGREHFLLEAQLSPSRSSEVWLARHAKTREARVYKFSADGERLAMLKREVTLFRVLRESLGERDDLVRILDWNFEAPPFFLECEYGGLDLQTWAATGDPLTVMPLEARIALFLQIADALAAAHSVGVLHKDLKPGNVLVAPRAAASPEGGWQLRLTDFGSGRLLQPDRLAELGITRLGMTMTHSIGVDSSDGTPLYLAPELIIGQAPTVQSDLFALGLLLYQVVVGDFRKPMASGWEQDVADDLLCEDIAAATDGHPAQRLSSVAELGERLRTREMRWAERSRLLEVEARALTAERLLERTRARRPWVAAAVLVLVAGLVVALLLNRRAERARNEALQQAAMVTAINRFLNEDLLGAGPGSKVWYEKNPSLREILDLAKGRVAARFGGAPLAEAGIHTTLGRAYRSLGDFKNAETELRRAVDLQHAVLAAGDERLLIAHYELASVLSSLSQFKEAGQQLAAADATTGLRLAGSTELALRARLARAAYHYQQMQAAPALAAYEAARPLQRLLHPQDAGMAALIDQSIAGCQMRLGHPERAEAMLRPLLAGAPFTEAMVGRSTLGQARKLLSDALRDQGRYVEALPLAEQAVADSESTVGRDSQLTIGALSSLGYLYSLLGDEAKALTVQREVYVRALRGWGAGSQYSLIELLNLAEAERAVGDLIPARDHYAAAERGLTVVAGVHSAVVQPARYGLAGVLHELGHNDEALAQLQSVDVDGLKLATAAPGSGARLDALKAEILIDQGQTAAGGPLLAEAVQAMEEDGVVAADLEPFRRKLRKLGARMP